jgi:AmiR/NasT family two-component response regulator
MSDSAGNGFEAIDRVAEAVELICAQRDCGHEQAFDLLREKAFQLSQTMEYTAFDVLDRIIRFD